MTQPNEYAAQLEDIEAQLDALLQKIAADDYCERVPRKEFQRDIAAALELVQKKQEILTEILDDMDCGDKKYFTEYCQKFDKVMEQHGRQ